MTNPYLDRLLAEKSKTSVPQSPTKLTKPPSDGTLMGFVGFVSDQESRFSKNGGPYARVMSALERRCPDHVPRDCWLQAVADARTFLAQWGTQAHALGWSNADLFGLFPVPSTPHPSFDRLSRYDATGLLWLLQGQRVLAMTETTATLTTPTGGTLTYRRFNKPGLGPLGDSLDDFTGGE